MIPHRNSTNASKRSGLARFRLAGLAPPAAMVAVRVVETEEITQARKRLFGFTLPKIGLFSGDDGEEVETLTSTITRVRQIGAKEYLFWIEEGNAQWRMKSNSIRFRAPKVGDSVEFKPATMGTYWIRVNGRKGVRGNRIG